MALVALDEAKMYLRVDSADEDVLISGMIDTAEALCADVARLDETQWEAVNSEEPSSLEYSERRMKQVRGLMRVAVLYALGYLYEHREEADHHDLVLTLRSLLFSIREGVF